MDILDALKFVKGAVSTKNMVPEMKHFVIQQGTVRAFNGTLTISSPIDFATDCNPKAVAMVNAINMCEEKVGMRMTANHRLHISSGHFQVNVDCAEGAMPHLLPAGEFVDIDGQALFDGLKALSNFVGNDAARPWSNGVLFTGASAFATNNVCLAEYWTGAAMPFDVNIPAAAIKELLRVGETPTHVQVEEEVSCTFHFTGDRWIRTQLLPSQDWPDLSPLLNVESNPQPVPDQLFENLAKLKPFMEADNRVFFDDGCICTTMAPDSGARIAVEGLAEAGIFNYPMFCLLQKVATHVDFSRYPEPLTFQGDRIRGVIMGYRQ